MDKMYQQEATLLAKVVAWLEPQRRDGIVVLKIRDMYTIGYSDLFIIAKGRFVAAELKSATGKPSPMQLEFIRMIEDAGGVGGVCRTIKDVADLIDRALR